MSIMVKLLEMQEASKKASAVQLVGMCEQIKKFLYNGHYKRNVNADTFVYLESTLIAIQQNNEMAEKNTEIEKTIEDLRKRAEKLKSQKKKKLEKLEKRKETLKLKTKEMETEETI